MESAPFAVVGEDLPVTCSSVFIRSIVHETTAGIGRPVAGLGRLFFLTFLARARSYLNPARHEKRIPDFLVENPIYKTTVNE